MIKLIEYKVKFPLNADFKKDPEILFLSKIYNEIYQCTCINKQNKCDNCVQKMKCIYYFLSGENFTKYPAIGIKRSIINKRIFSSNDVLNLRFYLIGVSVNYAEFITAFMLNEETIGKYFFQKVQVRNELIQENELYEGKICFQNVIVNLEDIVQSIKYYNEKYKSNFYIPILKEEKNEIQFNDETVYKICNKIIKIKGKTIDVKTRNFSNLFFEIGLGKYGFLGGGDSKCELE